MQTHHEQHGPETGSAVNKNGFVRRSPTDCMYVQVSHTTPTLHCGLMCKLSDNLLTKASPAANPEGNRGSEGGSRFMSSMTFPFLLERVLQGAVAVSSWKSLSVITQHPGPIGGSKSRIPKFWILCVVSANGSLCRLPIFLHRASQQESGRWRQLGKPGEVCFWVPAVDWMWDF